MESAPLISSHKRVEMLARHMSWDEVLPSDVDSTEFLDRQLMPTSKPVLAESVINNIPYYRCPNGVSDLLSKHSALRNEMYQQFFESAGCIAVRGVFATTTMVRYNKWCENYLEHAKKNHLNCRHPKQKDKFLINDLLEAMSESDPDLLLMLINNPVYNAIMDTLLGFSTIGAFTTHWIGPKGDRQMSHVDYPMHLGSGKFWHRDSEEGNMNGGGSVPKLMELTTRHQINHILPFFSVQTLIASDAMDASNGSTECVPFSHRITDVDLKIASSKAFYEGIERRFVNTRLQQGDIFIFNRRLCHRGGKNNSNHRRNSAIMQCVWLWGVGQHHIDGASILRKLSRSPLFQKMSVEEKERFCLRLTKPYPIDTTKHT